MVYHEEKGAGQGVAGVRLGGWGWGWILWAGGLSWPSLWGSLYFAAHGGQLHALTYAETTFRPEWSSKEDQGQVIASLPTVPMAPGCAP